MNIQFLISYSVTWQHLIHRQKLDIYVELQDKIELVNVIIFINANINIFILQTFSNLVGMCIT